MCVVLSVCVLCVSVCMCVCCVSLCVSVCALCCVGVCLCVLHCTCAPSAAGGPAAVTHLREGDRSDMKANQAG